MIFKGGEYNVIHITLLRIMWKDHMQKTALLSLGKRHQEKWSIFNIWDQS